MARHRPMGPTTTTTATTTATSTLSPPTRPRTPRGWNTGHVPPGALVRTSRTTRILPPPFAPPRLHRGRHRRRRRRESFVNSPPPPAPCLVAISELAAGRSLLDVPARPLRQSTTLLFFSSIDGGSGGRWSNWGLQIMGAANGGVVRRRRWSMAAVDGGEASHALHTVGISTIRI